MSLFSVSLPVAKGPLSWGLYCFGMWWEAAPCVSLPRAAYSGCRFCLCANSTIDRSVVLQVAAARCGCHARCSLLWLSAGANTFFFSFLLFPSKLNELLCYLSSLCSTLHPTVLITRCCFWRYEEQQSPQGDNRVNFFRVLQNSPFSELQIVFHDRWLIWWAVSWNISLALNFSGFLEVSEGNVRIALVSRTLYGLPGQLEVIFEIQRLELEMCFLLFCKPKPINW